jgi:MFS family permease
MSDSDSSPLANDRTNAAIQGHDPYAALRVPAFRWYLCGWVLSVIGQQLQSVAVGWEVSQRTHSALWLGLVGLTQAGPLLILALPAGHLADWADRKLIAMCAMFASAISTSALGFVVYHHGSLLAMYALLTVDATALALGGPARSALLPRILSADKFSNAVSWYSSLFQVASVTGPAIAGLLIRRATWPAFVIDGLCAAWFGVVISKMKLLPSDAPRQPPTLDGLAEGIRFVYRKKIILATITLDLFAVLLGGAVALLPLVATDILHVGSVGYGWLRAAPAVGAFLMAIVVAHRKPMKHAGQAMLWAVAGFGAATVVFGFSQNYWLSLAMLFLTGAFDNISVLVRHTLVQVLTPDNMRGRVNAVNNVFIGSSNHLGDFESGVTAWMFGLVGSIVFGGIGTILVVIAAFFAWPEVSKFGSLKDAAQESAPQAEPLGGAQ